MSNVNINVSGAPRHGKSIVQQALAEFARGGIVGKKADMLIMDDCPTMYGRPPMKFAPVAPYHIYRQFVINNYVPQTILLLAHDVVANEAEYKETFDHIAWSKTTIIMDNSLVETGGAVDEEMVAKASEIVGADVVVLPDVMGDGAKSADATIEAWQTWSWDFRDYQKMVVLHGVSDADWYASAEKLMLAGIRPEWLSIPRKCEDGTNRRWRLLNMAKMIFGIPNFHLLGFSDFVASDLVAASHPLVRSIDSAVPLRLTTNAILSEDAGPRGDWWDTCEFDQGMIARCQLVDGYINNIA